MTVLYSRTVGTCPQKVCTRYTVFQLRISCFFHLALCSFLKTYIRNKYRPFPLFFTVSVFFGTRVTCGRKSYRIFSQLRTTVQHQFVLQRYCFFHLFPMPHLSTQFHVAAQFGGIDHQLLIPPSLLLALEQLFAIGPTA